MFPVVFSVSRPSVNVTLKSPASHDGKGLTMKKVAVAAIAAFSLSAVPALAADLVTKAKPVAAPPPSAWDIAFGSALTSDYLFRGITQSNHKPSVNAYFEPRYNINADHQLYLGVAGNSISFPNRPAAEIDLYGGWRPTFGKLALDFGAWYYWYPGGQCFNTAALCAALGGGNFQAVGLPNGNVIKADVNFWEVYAKATYNITDAFAIGFAFNYSPSVLNSGARGYYYNGNAKYTFPAFSNGVTPYISGQVGYWDLGTSDAFYAIPAFPAGIPYKKYTHWDAGFGWAYKVFTVDLRYSDTNLSKGDCNAFTSDHTASGAPATTAINPAPLPGSNWCGPRFVATLKADLTLNTNIK
jgi:uncharacterized protein (TIGR02001 family)